MLIVRCWNCEITPGVQSSFKPLSGHRRVLERVRKAERIESRKAGQQTLQKPQVEFQTKSAEFAASKIYWPSLSVVVLLGWSRKDCDPSQRAWEFWRQQERYDHTLIWFLSAICKWQALKAVVQWIAVHASKYSDSFTIHWTAFTFLNFLWFVTMLKVSTWN